MSNKDYWFYYDITRNWKGASQAERDDTIEYFLDSANMQNGGSYWYLQGMASLINYLPERTLEIVKAVLTIPDTTRYIYKYSSLGEIISAGSKVDVNNEIKKMVINHANPLVNKLSLIFDGLTHEEEAGALKHLSNSKWCPPAIYEQRYQPSIEALKMLPPVCRLKVIESLLSNNNLAYNIFGKILDGEEFKTLIFGSVLRHRERAEVVWKKYQESINLGKPGLVEISGMCDNCGPFKLTLESNRTRTSVGFNNTRVSRYIYRNNCMLCGSHIDGGVTIKANGDIDAGV